MEDSAALPPMPLVAEGMLEDPTRPYNTDEPWTFDMREHVHMGLWPLPGETDELPESVGAFGRHSPAAAAAAALAEARAAGAGWAGAFWC